MDTVSDGGGSGGGDGPSGGGCRGGGSGRRPSAPPAAGTRACVASSPGAGTPRERCQTGRSPPTAKPCSGGWIPSTRRRVPSSSASRGGAPPSMGVEPPPAWRSGKSSRPPSCARCRRRHSPTVLWAGAGARGATFPGGTPLARPPRSYRRLVAPAWGGGFLGGRPRPPSGPRSAAPRRRGARATDARLRDGLRCTRGDPPPRPPLAPHRRLCWTPERSSLRAHTVEATYVRPRSSAARSGKTKSLPIVLGYLAPFHAPLIPELLAPAPSATDPTGAHSSPSGHRRATARSPCALPRAPAPVPTHALPACSAAPSNPYSAHALRACSCTT